jgi:hypothetical protein
VAGYGDSEHDGDKTETSRGSTDYWVLKLDESGNKLWDRRFGGSQADEAKSIIPLPDGSYLVAGNSSSGLGFDKSGLSRGFTDYWVVKIDGEGNKIWDTFYGGSGHDRSSGIVLAPDDASYVVGGWSESGLGGDKSEPLTGDKARIPDCWVVKFGNCPGSPAFAVQKSETGVVCPGTITGITLTAVSDSAYTYSWQPGNQNASTITVTPE